MQKAWVTCQKCTRKRSWDFVHGIFLLAQASLLTSTKKTRMETIVFCRSSAESLSVALQGKELV